MAKEDTLLNLGLALLTRLDRLITILESTNPGRLKTPGISSVSTSRPKKTRRVSDATYLEGSKELVRILLQAKEVGKMTTSLCNQLRMTKTTFRLILSRLMSEVNFLKRVGGKGGHASSISIGDRDAAEHWLTLK